MEWPFWAYLKWGMEIEAPIFILSAIGIAIAFIKARHRFAMFAGLWAFGLLAAYSIIPYKTPWLALSFLLPMCLAAGYGINEIARAGSNVWRTAALILGFGAAGGQPGGCNGDDAQGKWHREERDAVPFEDHFPRALNMLNIQ